MRNANCWFVWPEHWFLSRAPLCDLFSQPTQWARRASTSDVIIPLSNVYFHYTKIASCKKRQEFPTPLHFGENLFLDKIAGVREGEEGRRRIPCPTHKKISERRFSTSFHPNSFGVNTSHPHKRPPNSNLICAHRQQEKRKENLSLSFVPFSSKLFPSFFNFLFLLTQEFHI